MPAAPRFTVAWTKTAIDALKPSPEGRRYHYDARVPGLAVLVTERGAKSFYLVRRVGRRSERIRLGGWPQMTPDQARDAAQSYNGQIVGGWSPAENRKRAANATTFADAYQLLLSSPPRMRRIAERSKSTLDNYRYWYKHLAGFADRKLSAISRPDVERLHASIGSSAGKVVANRVLSLAKAVLERAVDAELLEHNPAARVRRFAETTRARFLRPEEMPELLRALNAYEHHALKDFVLLALFTGQRRANVVGMRWADVRLDDGLWEIPRTKTGRHTVPLIPQAVEILRRRKSEVAESEWVFPARRKSGPWGAANFCLRSALNGTSLEDVTIHDLRRSLASWQVRTGANLPVVGRTLGHSQPQTTAIYARLDDEPVRKAMQTAVEAMLAAAQPAPPAPATSSRGGGSNACRSSSGSDVQERRNLA